MNVKGKKNPRILVTVHFEFLILTRKASSGGLSPDEECKEEWKSDRGVWIDQIKKSLGKTTSRETGPPEARS